MGADRSAHRGRPDAPDPVGPNGGPLGPAPRGRGVCGPTERHVGRGARGRAVLPSEVPMDGPSVWASGLAENGPAVPPPPRPLPRDLSVSSERRGSVLGHQTAPRTVPTSPKRGDAAEGGRVADDREECRSTGPSAGRSGGGMNYGTQPPVGLHSKDIVQNISASRHGILVVRTGWREFQGPTRAPLVPRARSQRVRIERRSAALGRASTTGDGNRAHQSDQED